MMRDMEQLPPDQRAVLSLVLAQGRSYGEVASALGMEEGSVRERAHAALDALAAQDVSAQQGRTPLDVPSAPLDVPSAPAGGAGPGSRRAGAALLAAIVVVGAVVAIVLSSGGKGSPSPTGATTAASSSAGSGNSSASGSSQGSSNPSASGAGKATPAQEVHLDKRFALTPAGTESKASGVGLVVSKGSTRAFYVSTTGLPAPSGFFYAVWLYNSQSESFPLGRLPAKPEANGSLEGGGPLRAPHLSSFHRLVVTRETSNQPSAPGRIVLSGPFALH